MQSGTSSNGPSVVIDGEIGELYCPTCETSFASGESCPRDGMKLVKLVATADPLVGKVLDGRFTILEKLGQGGMGCVYRASQHSVSREVAIKVVHANLVSDPAVIKRFLREAKLASRLSHPNAVSVMDFGQTEDGLFYLVMELLEGKTLDVVLEQQGLFDARKLIRVGMEVCDALDAAHALSIIHRDLKPSNILMLDTARDFVKVLDFGLAKSLANETASEMTGSGNMIGTPAYMPPERACGETGDARSDLYALGCILFLLGTGSLPFDAVGTQDLLLKQVMEPAPPMTNVPWALAQVVDKLLKKEPAQRYQSAAETRFALELALEDLPGPSRVSQPSIVIDPIGALGSGPHVTMESQVAPSGPRYRRLKSTAVERLERSDTVDAPAVSSSGVIPAADLIDASAITVPPTLVRARRRSTAKLVVAAMKTPRARWVAAAISTLAIAVFALVSVASRDVASAAPTTATELTAHETPSLPGFARGSQADPAATPVEVAAEESDVVAPSTSTAGGQAMKADQGTRGARGQARGKHDVVPTKGATPVTTPVAGRRVHMPF